MGYCPDWYDLLRSAKYLGVAPWELRKQPLAWQDWARAAEGAENAAQAAHDKREAARAQAKSRR